ncbi:glucosamine-6-phosphate deaminase [Formosa sediminum]|uniref:Glucosamine-6-phosphate deaminase n=1 Tax=Formosa sediminum TaxID=2594004 RepID=A0A516GUI6_9FLAO|nr:glucosamine-6-phosphate deaminase [Formosa sediminum]QDO95184.1 glucosamine-6-phosphate deaminase [Formosa sediminum]
MPNNTQNINIYKDKEATGIAAGQAIEDRIVKLQKTQDIVRIIFAAAPSQDSMLNYLTASTLIDWNRITAFNMDEYIGLPPKSNQLFASYLERNLFSKVEIQEKNLIQANTNISEELIRYSKLVQKETIDIVCLGIGENGHIAFNDPPVADFNDSEIIKVVILDDKCRNQQVNDGCFETIDDVPQKAITLTIPTLLNAKYLYCVVLGINKSDAVKNTITGPITTSCPASILRTHAYCNFYFDQEAYSKIDN